MRLRGNEDDREHNGGGDGDDSGSHNEWRRHDNDCNIDIDTSSDWQRQQQPATATGNSDNDEPTKATDYNGDYGLMKAAATGMTSRQQQCDNDGDGVVAVMWQWRV